MSPAPRTRPAYWLAGFTIALAVLSLAAVGLIAVRLDRVGEPAFFFLTWNLFLAWIPYVLAICVAAVHGRGGPRPLLWVLGAAWLLFLPNAPYILTDFIHLGRIGGAPLWFDAALIGTFAAAGLALGLASLLVMHHVVEARPPQPRGGGAAAARRPTRQPLPAALRRGHVDPAARLLPHHLGPRARPPRASYRPRSGRSPLRSFRSRTMCDSRAVMKARSLRAFLLAVMSMTGQSAIAVTMNNTSVAVKNA